MATPLSFAAVVGQSELQKQRILENPSFHQVVSFENISPLLTAKCNNRLNSFKKGRFRLYQFQKFHTFLARKFVTLCRRIFTFSHQIVFLPIFDREYAGFSNKSMRFINPLSSLCFLKLRWH